jgi:Zn-dependent peptidase ImmA (M78 family)/DNA-binding XRE family transcriptional regulator
MNRNINPEMLTLAREARGMTQSDLAAATEIAQSQISKFEAGLQPIPNDLLLTVATALNYPTSLFFRSDPIKGFGVSFIFHRKRAAASAGELRKVQAQLNKLRIEVTNLLRGAEIECESRFQQFDIRDHAGGAGEIARLVRASWMLPLGPIADLTAAVESAGGIVWRCSFGTKAIDALSQWISPTTPLFFLNTDFPEDRLRFSLAHEIAHISMHNLPTANMEADADEFAAEILMPAAEIEEDLKQLTIERAATLKPYWRTSMAAIIKRAADLKCISEYQYRRLYTRLGAVGYRMREPIDLPTEEPSIIRQLIEVHQYDHGYSIAELSKLVDLHEQEFRERYMPAEDRPQLRMAN